MDGFIPYTHDSNQVPAHQRMPAGAITPKVGMALRLDDGNLVAATGANKPDYICMETQDAAVAAGTMIQVMRVSEHIRYKTSFSAAASDLKVGDKVTISADAMQVTTTTTGGVARVEHIEDSAADGEVLVRFI